MPPDIRSMYKTITFLYTSNENVDTKLKNIIPFTSFPLKIALLSIYPQNTKTLIRRDTCTSVFIAALFTVAKLWKQLNCPQID